MKQLLQFAQRAGSVVKEVTQSTRPGWLLRVSLRKARNEHKFSQMPPIADLRSRR